MTGETGASPALPVVRKIGPADLKDALARGLDDFWAVPTHIVFLGLVYPVVGLVLGRLAFGYGMLPLLFPMVAGFALIGPFAAIGLYELSSRREKGLDVSWSNAFDVLHSPSIGAIAMVGGMLLVIFLIWLNVAQALYALTFGDAEPASLAAFLHDILTTDAGWTLIVLGNAVGLFFAVAALSLSVVSFPLLIDRKVGAAVAIQTSVRAVLANPGTMALWGLIVAIGLVIGSLPFLVGLAIVVPVLGHATWHLYRKVVER
jgi:uncharacterized membrane protein